MNFEERRKEAHAWAEAFERAKQQQYLCVECDKTFAAQKQALDHEFSEHRRPTITPVDPRQQYVIQEEP